MDPCEARISDETLLDYWLGDADAVRVELVETHLFTCASCTARLGELRALHAGIATLGREGRVSGILSRSLLNRMQRDGVRVRLYSVSPGETVPCAVFPDDDLLVAALRANFTNADRVALSMVSTHQPFVAPEELTVSPSDTEVLWAVSAAHGRTLPSMRLQLTLTTADADARVLGEYVLEHTALERP
jgi:hypothetical protein